MIKPVPEIGNFNHGTRSGFLFIVLLLTLQVNISAQPLSFESVKPPEGILYGLVNGIAQDRAGYIWFTTQVAGLNRYNGYAIKSYFHDPLKSNSIANNRTECVYADRNGMLWIGTFGSGLDLFNPLTETFTHFTYKADDATSLGNDTVTSVLRDHLGILWIGTHRGLSRYDSASGKFTQYVYDAKDNSSISNNHVRSLYEDHQGTLWIGTGSPFIGDNNVVRNEGGLNKFNRSTNKFTRYLHDPNDPHSLIDNRVKAMFEDSKGNFWVGTAGDGLHSMDRATGTFERHLYDPAHPDQLSRPPVKKLYEYADDHITFISEDVSGALWIGTLEAGINRYDPKTLKMAHYGSDTLAGDSKTFKENGAWQLFTSRDGMLWICAWQENLYRVDPFQVMLNFEPITGTSVNAFATEDSNVLLIGTPVGLLRKDNKGMTSFLVNDPSNQASLSNDYVQCMLKRRDGAVWIGTYNGLNKYDDKNRSFKVIRHNAADKKSLPSDYITALYEDHGNNLWVGTIKGVSMMDPGDFSFKNYVLDVKDTNAFSTNTVSAMCESRWGEFWLGSWSGGGVRLFDRAKGTVKTYLQSMNIVCLYEDTDSVLWVGSEYGLYEYRRNLDSFYLFIDKSLPAGISNVGNILEDDHKNLWITIATGILKINRARNETSLYGSRYGVKAANTIAYFSGYKGPGTEFFIGDQNGYYSFFPDLLTKSGAPPQINITGFSLADRMVVPSAKGPLFQDLWETKEIRLNYNQNVFSFDFESIDYRDPDNNRHIYMLENYDPSWRQSGTERKAFYFNIPPGEYIFKVKAANSNGIWAEKDIRVIITPPWWRTWWAYTLYALLIVAAAIIANRFIRKRIIEKEKIKAREKELEHAKEIEKAYHELKLTQAQLIHSEKMASLGELTAGIAHEIQNPLNFVNNFAEVNTELIDEARQEMIKGNITGVETILNDIRDNEEKINHHGKRADSIVKSMLQHTRTSSGIKEPTDINALADEYLRLSYHGLRSKDKSFNATMKVDFDETIGKINIIPQDIGRVLLNLYNNAFYAVNEKQKNSDKSYDPVVSVGTKKSGNRVEIAVTDNGNGIPQNMADKIFQPFFTTKPTGQGTGLGLSLSYDIVKAHGGEIKVESTEDKFTTIVVVL